MLGHELLHSVVTQYDRSFGLCPLLLQRSYA